MKKNNSVSSIIFDVVIYSCLILLMIVTLYPVLHVAAVSLSSSLEVMKGGITFYPRDLSLQAYKLIFKTPTIPRGFKNSLIYASLGTAINLIMTTIMAYPLSKKYLTFKGFYTTLIVITMFFGGGIIPSFLVIRWLGMYNTMWALVIPPALNAFNIIILRTFFQSIPAELEESAYLDGANDIQILVKIVLPLSKAAIATIALFCVVGHWNSYFDALIYIRDFKKMPLQLILRELVIEGQIMEKLGTEGNIGYADELHKASNTESLKYATLFISILPMLVVYPFVQKYFVKGVMIGSLKG